MTQRDRDRLVVLKKAQKKLITQKQAAAELEVTQRQVGRLLKALKRRGDTAVIHGLRGRVSNRKLSETTREDAVRRWDAGCSLSGPLFEVHRMPAAAEGGGGHSHDIHRQPTQRSPATQSCASTGNARRGQIRRPSHLESCQDRPDSYSWIDLNSERRAKAARRSSRLIYPKTAARELHQSRSSVKNQNPQNGQLSCPGLTGGLAPSASEPAPSQRSSDLPRGARLPRNIEFNLIPLRRFRPSNRTFLLGRE